MRYLLDTNIVSDLLRNPRGPITHRIRQVGEAAVCTSIIVAAELRYGAAKKASPLLTERVETILARLAIMPFETPADAVYGRLRAQLEARGRLIGGNDLLIAAQSLALDCTLVSDNETEFARIEGLTRENWLRA